MENNILKWLTEWYQSECNGDWEHSYGIRIKTLDNPGWSIEIDLNETIMESYELASSVIKNEENDWYDFSFKDAKFKAYGDSNKLEFLLNKFKEEVERINPKR